MIRENKGFTRQSFAKKWKILQNFLKLYNHSKVGHQRKLKCKKSFLTGYLRNIRPSKITAYTVATIWSVENFGIFDLPVLNLTVCCKTHYYLVQMSRFFFITKVIVKVVIFCSDKCLSTLPWCILSHFHYSSYVTFIFKRWEIHNKMLKACRKDVDKFIMSCNTRPLHTLYINVFTLCAIRT